MKLMFRKILFAGSAAAILALPVLAQDAEIENVEFGAPEALSIVSDTATHEFMVEVASEPEQLTRGMMYRDEVPVKTGMLFEYDNQSILSIWMKNTSVSLDIIFVRKNGKILKIEHSATPYSLRSISSEATAAAVLELGGGQALELGIMPGDLVQHEFFGTAKPEAGSSQE